MGFEAYAQKFGEWLADIVFVEVPIIGVEAIVIWLFAPMLIFTIYFGFINLRSFNTSFRILKGKFHDPDAPGEVSQFQALSTALSGTVGLGNIAGVAIAISMGGPGATFWMILIGLLAMSLKFAECTMGVKYREIHEDGTVSGGPMYYLWRGVKNRGFPKIGKFLGWSYAILALPSIFQLVQVNQAYSQFSYVTEWDVPWVFGIVLAILVGVVIIGGIKSIAKVTARLVPMMCVIYLLATLTILFTNAGEIPAAFATIFEEAFNPRSATVGSLVGVFVIGMRRAVYSTEAGLGTATIAHAAAKTKEPVSEGMVALLEPFIDTVVISTMTALVIVITGAYAFEGLNDIQVTSAAFTSEIPWFKWILALAVLLFAFSTIISWGYYLSRVWNFVFGRTPRSELIYKILFCVLLIPGGAMNVDTVINITDSVFFMMAVPNIIGLYILAPELKRDLASYLARLKSGEIKTSEQLKAEQT